jgi:hypothetical protein
VVFLECGGSFDFYLLVFSGQAGFSFLSHTLAWVQHLIDLLEKFLGFMNNFSILRKRRGLETKICGPLPL